MDNESSGSGTDLQKSMTSRKTLNRTRVVGFSKSTLKADSMSLNNDSKAYIIEDDDDLLNTKSSR